MKNLIIPLSVVLLLLFAGCSTAEPEPTTTPVPPTNTPAPSTDTPTPEIKGDPERGREIFENGTEEITKKCTDCHTLTGYDATGPSLQGIAERSKDRLPELSAVEYLQQSIFDPGAYIVEGFEGAHMSSLYKYFSEEEVDDLVAFLLTQ